MNQEQLDACKYPPTMTYDWRTLEPTGVLAERVRLIERLCPTFFRADLFLDVGASKGFFSLTAAVAGALVTAIEPDREALKLWEARDPLIVVHHGTFGSFASATAFDTVWIGNGPHYLHREDQDWIEKLALMASGRVLMEGPVGRACKDVRDWAHVLEEGDLVQRMQEAGFALRGRVASPTYTPNRAIWYFERP